MAGPDPLTAENLLLRKRLDRAMRDMRLLEEAKDRYDALYAHTVASLLESEAKYRNLAEHLSEGLVTTDPELRLTYYNPGFAALLGHGPEVPPLATLADLAPPGDRDAFRDHLLDASHGPREFALRHRDGTIVEVLLSTVALRGPDHASSGFLVLFTDIRGPKQVMETRRHALKMESLVLMAGSIAHDFNNLFQAVMSTVEVASHQASCAPEAVRTLGGTQVALRRAVDLSLRMMDFSGLVISRREQILLPELLAGWIPGLAPAKENRRLELASGDVPAISADPANLRRAVEAILMNAWEAMDEVSAPQGRVQFKVSESTGRDSALGFWAVPRPGPGSMVCLEIANDGPCPRPEVLPRMFDPFFTTKALGRGLGLASARGLLQAQGAGIQVLPGAEGGLSFRLHFPPVRLIADLPCHGGANRRTLNSSD